MCKLCGTISRRATIGRYEFSCWRTPRVNEFKPQIWELQKERAAKAKKAKEKPVPVPPRNLFFLELDPDVRLEIYRYLFADLHIVIDQTNTASTGGEKIQQYRTGWFTNILRTCKLINAEATLILSIAGIKVTVKASTHSTYSPYSSVGGDLDWQMRRIPVQMRQHVKTLRFLGPRQATLECFHNFANLKQVQLGHKMYNGGMQKTGALLILSLEPELRAAVEKLKADKDVAYLLDHFPQIKITYGCWHFDHDSWTSTGYEIITDMRTLKTVDASRMRFTRTAALNSGGIDHRSFETKVLAKIEAL